MVITGRLSARDEKEPQIVVDTIRPISDLDGAPGERPAPAQPQKLWVKVKSAGDPVCARIKRILVMFPGTQQMIIYCEDTKKKLGARCVIHDALVKELGEILGEENVVVK